MKKYFNVCTLFFVILFFVLLGWSQIPQTLSYQGMLKDAGGTIVPNGTYQLTFRLYQEEMGGTPVWNETQMIPINDGIFNVILGVVTPLQVPFDKLYWLGVTVGTGTELPRIRLTSSAYSLNAKTVEDTAITTAKIADGAVTLAKLSPGLSLPPGGAAGGDLSGTYPNPQIADNAVNSGKIQDGTIQLTDLAFTPLSRPLSPGVSSAEIADNAVTTPKIEDGAITQAKLSPGLSLPPGGAAGGDLTGTYPNPSIAAGVVNTSKLADNAVTSAKIVDGTIAATDLASNAVTTVKIQDGAVTQAKLDPGVSLPPGGNAGGDLSGTYPNPSIAAGVVNTTKLADNSVTSAKIVDGTIAAADIANDAVTTTKIADGAVTQAKIATGVTLPPSGTAGGDLSGSYPNPTVDGLQGRAVASTAPSSGQVLKWSGSQWAPSTDETGTSFWSASGSDIYSNNAGNVGIGTTTPGYKLQVVGDIQVGYTNTYRIGAYTGLSWNSSNGSINVGSPSSQPLQLLAGTSVPRIYINNVNGRVGVGTLNPIARIHATTSGRYAGYFSADSFSLDTHVIHSEYTGSVSIDAVAVYGYSHPAAGWGIGGQFTGGYYGVYGNGDGGDYAGEVNGIYGYSSGSNGRRYGIYGYAVNVMAPNRYAQGVVGYATGYNCAGVVGMVGPGEIRYAGMFDGNVAITGTLSKAGGSFKIDHPLDPENKYLYHSFVESPDMKNIYDGVVTLDDNGQAWVELPEWFGALNKDFRYQLTCIGGYAPVYIAQEISGNRFKIAGGNPGMKVSWQVTGIRQDAWAQQNRIPVEELKRTDERGLYLHPEAFGQPENRGINYQARKAVEENSKRVQ